MTRASNENRFRPLNDLNDLTGQIQIGCQLGRALSEQTIIGEEDNRSESCLGVKKSTAKPSELKSRTKMGSTKTVRTKIERWHQKANKRRQKSNIGGRVEAGLIRG